MDEVRVAEPRERIGQASESQARSQQPWQGGDQRRRHMAERASVMPIRVGIDDFKWMEYRVACQHKQRRQAQAGD